MTINVNSIHVGAGVLALDEGLATALTVEASEEGGTLAFSATIENIEIDEAIGPVEVYITREEWTVAITCKEIEASKVKASMGHGTITTTAAGAGTKGKDVLEFGSSSTATSRTLKYTVPRRHNPALNVIVELYKVVAVPSLEKKFTKKGQTMIAMTFRALNDMTKVAGKRLGKITYETAEATS